MRYLAAAICVWALALSLPAGAEDLASPVPKGSGLTYADLLRQICPDLEIDKDDASSGSASQSIPIRQLGGKDPPEAFVEPIQVEGARTLDAKIAGRPQVLLMFDIKTKESPDRPTRELALFDIAGARPGCWIWWRRLPAPTIPEACGRRGCST